MRRLILAMLATACAVMPASAQSLKSDEVYSSIVVAPESQPHPVLGSDNRIHLAYELVVTNPSRLFMTLDKVEAVDDAGKSLWLLEKDALGALIEPFAGGGATLPPGGMAAVFMDVSFAADEKLPERVSARVTTTRQSADKDGKPAPMPADSPVPATITFTGSAVAPGAVAAIVEPPLRGKGWVAVNGCCDAITSHRGAIMAVNGQMRIPERFAIDWIKLDEGGHVFTGDVTKLESYAYYGTPIHAVADGTVVNLYDDTDEQVPSEPAKGINTDNIGGNMLVIQIADGVYSFYAHMQRGSLKVKLGDHVKAGDVIGLLGNTGNSTAPHLHFHLMDGPSPLNANGLPFVFPKFTTRGVMKMSDGDDDPIEKGAAAQIDATKRAGEHINQLPLNNDVVDFPE